MGENHKRSSSDFQSILGVSKGASLKDICKAYKSIVSRWQTDKSSSSGKPEDVPNLKALNEAYFEALSSNVNVHGGVQNHKDNGGGGGGGGEGGGGGGGGGGRARPSPFDTSLNQHRSVEDQFYTPSFLSRGTSRRCKTPSPRSSPNGLPPSLSRSSSRKRNNTSANANYTSLGDLLDEPSSLTRSKSRGCNTSSNPSEPSFISRRSKTTPIMFSYSTTARSKPPPIEKQLECTLEELLQGCTKKIKISKDVITNTGLIATENETLIIKVKPGWRRGTKITFEGMGDEKPGFLPADIIFSIAEKQHSIFKREDDDLILSVEIPLVKSLTGCDISLPLLGGAKMVLALDEIVHPGYIKIIPGQGMPHPKDDGKRGDLRVKFRVIFPTKLSDEQRSDAFNLLQDCY